MGRTPRVTYLWPGLAQIWQRGAWSGLAMAVGFAILLNLTLATSLIWVELVPREICGAAWIAILVVWGGWAVLGLGWDRQESNEEVVAAANDLFRQAQERYLQRDWFETERILSQRLQSDPRDVESRLMLATLLRRTGRLNEATEELDRLGRMESSECWRWEIAGERGAVAQALTELDTMQEGHPQQDASVSQTCGADQRRAA